MAPRSCKCASSIVGRTCGASVVGMNAEPTDEPQHLRSPAQAPSTPDSGIGSNDPAESNSIEKRLSQLELKFDRVLDSLAKSAAVIAGRADRDDVPTNTSDPAVPSTPMASALPTQDAPNVRLTKQISFGAWAGKTDQLLRLERAAQDAMENSRSWTSLKQSHYRDPFKVTSTIVGAAGRMVRKGPMAALVAEVDSREIEGVSIQNETSEWSAREDKLPLVTIQLGRNERDSYPTSGSTSVKVTVSGNDKQWVGGAFDEIVSEIKKSVPWWAWFLTHAGTAMLNSILTGIIILGFLIPAPRSIWSELNTAVPVAVFAVLVGMIGGLGIGTGFRKWALRDFEVLDAGSKSWSGRVVAGLVTMVGLIGSIVTIIAVL